MEDVFITGINVSKYRNISDLKIALSDDVRNHLIITGKNGSGKTSLLKLVADNFTNIIYENRDIAIGSQILLVKEKKVQPHTNNILLYYNNINVGTLLLNNELDISNVLFINIPDEHLFNTHNSIDDRNIKKRYKDMNINEPYVSAYQNIIQTMVAMRIQYLEAKENNYKSLYLQSEKWFNKLLKVLYTIYDSDEVELKFIPKDYNYKIMYNGLDFEFDQMAGGFSAFFRIVSEIMEKMDYYTNYECDYTLPGIAFIDEIETHMHVSMQKMVLPFLTEMFPNVQFIVTTHSPFIINSIENTVVFDLSVKEQLENPSQYSYESIIEGYFDIDMYSQIMKDKLARYRELAFNTRSDEEKLEFSQLRVELQAISPAQKETYIAFKEIENKRKLMSNG